MVFSEVLIGISEVLIVVRGTKLFSEVLIGIFGGPNWYFGGPNCCPGDLIIILPVLTSKTAGY